LLNEKFKVFSPHDFDMGNTGYCRVGKNGEGSVIGTKFLLFQDLLFSNLKGEY